MAPTILFCGKNRVNFVLYQPVYQMLRKTSDARLALSTGRYKKRLAWWFSPKSEEQRNDWLYEPFDVDPDHLIRTGQKDKTPYEVYVTSNQSVRVQPRQCQKLVQIFQGVSFRNYAVDPGYLRFSKLFFIGRYHLDKYIEAGYLSEDDDRIELIGMPKLDCVVDGSIRRDEVLRELGLDPAVPTVLWCPTGASHNGLELLAAEGVKAVQELGVNLIIKHHDHPHRRPEKIAELHEIVNDALGERGRIAGTFDVAPLLVAADALITDASSVAYEYSLLDRPIVFVDTPRLLAQRADQDNCNMDMETHGRKVGRIVKTSEELKEALREELAAPDATASAARRRAAENIFYKPGTATRRSAKKLLEFAGVDSATAEASIAKAEAIK